MARRAERRERLARVRDRLAAEDKARREAQRARQEAWDAAAAAGKRRGHRPGDEPRANRAGTEPRANITDPDVRVMRNQKGYLAGYNGQAVVTANQVIAGAMLSQHPVDRTLLHPLLDQCRDQLAAAGIRPKLRTVLADSGYVSEENFARADQDKLRLLAPLAKDPGRPGGRPAKRARHLDQYPATARAIRRMRHPRGPEDYKLRARTVEPVSGQLKTCQKLTMMSRRGLAACESEWLPPAPPQSTEAAPAPRRGMTAKGPVPGGQDPLDRPKSRPRTRVAFQDPRSGPSHEAFVRQADLCIQPANRERSHMPLMASGYGVPDSARSPVPDVRSAWRAASHRTRVCTLYRPRRGRGTWSRCAERTLPVPGYRSCSVGRISISLTATCRGRVTT